MVIISKIDQKLVVNFLHVLHIFSTKWSTMLLYDHHHNAEEHKMYCISWNNSRGYYFIV